MYQRQVSFGEAIQMAIVQNYCKFYGRSSRSEYWWYQLFLWLLSCVVSLVFGEGSIAGLIDLGLLLPTLGLSVRRLHDTCHSGWWLLLALTGIGIFVLLYWFILDSYHGDNEYGPEPNMIAGIGGR